ncbi:unnamed protein product [Effrenium voratum]|nr:unnamed protein product [Effrenium voratum]
MTILRAPAMSRTCRGTLICWLSSGECKSNCTDATSSYNTKMAECQTKQTPVASKELQCATLESSATSALCAPYEGKLAVCKTYESCWSAAGSAAGNSLNTAQSIQDNLKTQWTALKRIQCLLDVLAKSGDQTAALTACIAKTHSTDSLTLTPAAAPTKEVCSAGTAPAACVA